MSVASDVSGRLTELLEGRASPAPRRAIPAGRFVRTEIDQPLNSAAGSGRPYPFGMSDFSKSQPLGVPSNVSGTHVWRGQGLVLWVAYSYDDHDQLARQQEILDDEKTIHRCLSDPLSWLAVDGVGVVGADSGNIQDAKDDRLLVLVININFTLREDYDVA